MTNQNEQTTGPIVITWPADTPESILPTTWKRLESGEIEAAYGSEAELRQSVYALALAQEAVRLGGVIR